MTQKQSATDAAWCVVITKPMAEEVAAAAIVRAGHRAYLPRCKRILIGHRATRGETVLRPLWPRYLFAEVHPDQGWRRITTAIGVADLIRDCEQRPALLADEIVAEIRRREDAQEFDQRRPGSAPVVVGQRVQLAAGPFSQMLGTVAQLRGNHRVAVFLDALGRIVSIERQHLDAIA